MSLVSQDNIKIMSLSKSNNTSQSKPTKKPIITTSTIKVRKDSNMKLNTKDKELKTDKEITLAKVPQKDQKVQIQNIGICEEKVNSINKRLVNDLEALYFEERVKGRSNSTQVQIPKLNFFFNNDKKKKL